MKYRLFIIPPSDADDGIRVVIARPGNPRKELVGGDVGMMLALAVSSAAVVNEHQDGWTSGDAVDLIVDGFRFLLNEGGNDE